MSRKSSLHVVVNKFAGIDAAAQDGQHQLKADETGIIGRPVLNGTPRPPVLAIGEKPEPPGSS
jgi:hypothetical protein